MNFNQLEGAIHSLIHSTIDNFSIFIETGEGNIAINAHEPRKAASVIKVPILIEAFRQIENKSLNPNALIFIDDDMKVGGAGIINCLTNSNVYSYRNLLELMIIVSDNTAANLILEKVGPQNVNNLAAQLSCKHTILARKFMDKDAQMAGVDNYTNAIDMLHYLKLIFEPNDLINENSRNQILKILYHQQLRDKLSSYLTEEDDVVIFNKTGDLSGVVHDVAVFRYQGKNVYAVILTQGWNNNGDAQKYIAEIGSYLIDHIKYKDSKGV